MGLPLESKIYKKRRRSIHDQFKRFERQASNTRSISRWWSKGGPEREHGISTYLTSENLGDSHFCLVLYVFVL